MPPVSALIPEITKIADTHNQRHQDECSRLPAPVPKALHMLPTFFNSSQKPSKAYVLIGTYFTNEEIEVQRGEVTRSGLHSERQSQWNQAQTVSLQRPQSQLHSLLEI